jgi:hypothetical protein
MGSSCVVRINKVNASAGYQDRKERLRADGCLERAELVP